MPRPRSRPRGSAVARVWRASRACARRNFGLVHEGRAQHRLSRRFGARTAEGRRGVPRATRTRLPGGQCRRARSRSRRHESARCGQVHHHERHAARGSVARGRRGRRAVCARQQTRRVARSARDRDFETRALVGGARAHAVRADQDRIRSDARHRHADHRASAHRWQVHRRTRDRHRPAERVRFVQLRGTDPFPARLRRRRAEAQRRPAGPHRRLAQRRSARARKGIRQGTRQVSGAVRRFVRRAQSAMAAEDRGAAQGRSRLPGGGRRTALRGPRRPARPAQQGWPQTRRRPRRQETKKN